MLKWLRPEQLMDLKIDYAFKQLFGVERNKDLTIVFLNAVLQREKEEEIKHITFENTEFAGEHEGDKKSRLDIVALTEKGEYINIEIQFTNEYDMVKRSLYYWAGLYRARIKEGEPYRTLQPVIIINILNFPLPEEKAPDFHHSYVLKNRTHHHQITSQLELHMLEIPTLISKWRKGTLDITHHLLARWLLLLGMVDRRNHKMYEDIYHALEEIAMSDKSLKGAFEQWEYLSASVEEKIAYERRLKQIMDAAAKDKEYELRVQDAEKEGLEKGMEQGMEKGIEQGMEKGIEKGMAEGKMENKRSVAASMLREGFEVEVVCRITGLDNETVQTIKNSQES